MSGRRPQKPADAAPRAPAQTFRVRDDTIVAIATAPGRGAIAIVRLSGSQAEQVCRRVVDPANGWPVRAREATRCRIHETDKASELIDDGLITVFPAPNSYTGETVIEIGTHGGAYVPLAVQAALVRAGARPAEPGEFTERAVLAGKLDLLRAEAIADLIDSRSRASHRMALEQLSGALSNRLALLRASIIEVEALLAYDVDFPSEDDGPISRERVIAACDACIADVDALLATVPAAILGREGATVVLAGAPNAGKSSLLNALVGESRVIVSDVPGTTRDAIEVLLEHDPWPLRLIDTAGLRENADPLERLGIEVSARWLARANVVVACGETPAALAAAVMAIAAHSSAPVVRALTKCDLVSNSYEMDTTVRVSAATGAGLEALLAEITRVIAADLHPVPADTPMVTRARHRAALEHARHELASFRAAWTANELPAPVAAVSVREAAHALDELIGEVDVDDVLARVFSSFCVGK